MFQAIQYVTSGFTLIAFLIACAAFIARIHLSRKERLIAAAPAAKRAELVEIALEGFKVDTTSLTKDQKYSLLMTQMSLKNSRAAKAFKIGSLVVVLACATTIAITWIIQVTPKQNGKDEKTTELNASMVSDYQQEMYADAEAVADEILKLDPKHFRALTVKGNCAIYDGDSHTAIKYLKQALDSKPDSRAIKADLAYAYMEIGAYQLAIDLYNSISDGQTDTACSLGRAYIYAGDYDRALQVLQSVSSSYSRGLARVLEATAVLGKAEREQSDGSKKQLRHNG